MLAPLPDGMGLDIDEYGDWKALQIVRNEEREEAESDDGRPQAQSNRKKRVVTDDAEIQAFFETS